MKQPHHNNEPVTTNEGGPKHSVTDLVQQIGTGFNEICASRDIAVELELDEVSDEIEMKTVRDALIAMVNHSIDAMPDGGSLEINLVNGGHQWELEVADTHNRCAPATGSVTPSPDDSRHELLAAIPQQPDRHLLKLDRLATELSATVQVYNCPLGGQAHVLVVPAKQYRVNRNLKVRRKAA